MQATMEVRWFYGGTIPPDMVGWFHQADQHSADPSPRVDHYLRIAEGDTLGIKLREGRIELKQRHRQYGAVRLHGWVAGIMEHWRKWSFPLAGLNDGLKGAAHPASDWIDVYKRRWLQRYEVLDEEKIAAVSSQYYPDQGCDFELTEVRAAGAAWWTLGFEAFGNEDTIQENLRLLADRVLGFTDPPVLAVEDSYGYPRWLQIVDGVRD
jgi:hypothetical protein